MAELSCWSQCVKVKTISLNISLCILIVKTLGTDSLGGVEEPEEGR